MNNGLWRILLAAWVVILLAGPACSAKESTPPEQNATRRVAILFDNPLADNTFALTCLRGAERAKGQYGFRLTLTEAGSDTEAGALLTQLAESQSHDLIICIGSSQTAALRQTAAKYPQQKFAQVDGDIADLPNISSLLTRDNESAYLAGALAVLVSKTGVIGFVGGREQPSIQRFLAGYRAGAQSIRPDCQVLFDYAGSWLNDGKTKSLALQQIARGADVLFGPAGAGSLGVIEAAREKGLWAIGVDADQSPVAPETVIVSTIKHVDVSVYGVIASLMENRFKGGILSAGLKEGAVEAKINSAVQAVSPSMQSQIDELDNKIISAEIKVPDQ